MKIHNALGLINNIPGEIIEILYFHNAVGVQTTLMLFGAKEAFFCNQMPVEKKFFCATFPENKGKKGRRR